MSLSLHEIIAAAKALGDDLKAASGVITHLTLMFTAANLLAKTLTKEKSFVF